MLQNEYKKYEQEYYRQKRLEIYQKARELQIPNTRKIQIFLYIMLLAFIVITDIELSFLISILHVKILYLLFTFIVIAEVYLRFLCIKFIECYQHYAKEETRRRCLCVPSCSEYAILCLKKYELIKALIKIRKRLFVTCKGDDYIIDYP